MRRTVGIGFALLVALSCGDDAEDRDSGAPADGRVGIDVQIRVVDDEGVPTSAEIAARLPDGERFVGTTDAEGRLTIPGVPFGEGRLDVSAWHSGYAVGGVLGLAAEQVLEELVIAMPAIPVRVPNPVADLHCSIADEEDGTPALADDEVLVVSTDVGGLYVGRGVREWTPRGGGLPGFDLRTPTDRPFQLFAFPSRSYGGPFGRVFEHLSPGIDGHAALLIELHETSRETPRVSGSITVVDAPPIRFEPELQSSVWGTTERGRLLVGRASVSEISGDLATFVLDYYTPAFVSELETRHELSWEGRVTTSMRFRGPPESGHIGQFLEPVEIRNDETREPNWIFQTGLQLAAHDSELRMTVWGHDLTRDEGFTIADFVLATGATQARIPVPPNSEVGAVVLDARALNVCLVRCAPTDVGECGREARNCVWSGEVEL